MSNDAGKKWQEPFVDLNDIPASLSIDKRTLKPAIKMVCPRGNIVPSRVGSPLLTRGTHSTSFGHSIRQFLVVRGNWATIDFDS